MMTETPIELDPIRIESEDAFRKIGRAFKNGRQIVPLLGSGVSVDAGFPVTLQLCDYLVRHRWGQKLREEDYGAAALPSDPWPSRHDLNAYLWASLGRENPYPVSEFRRNAVTRSQELNRDALFDEMRRETPTAAYAARAIFAQMREGKELHGTWYDEATGKIDSYTGYRSLLNFLCDRDTHLIDSFFDHFARGKRPSTTHQFIAYIVQLLRCRLILTTNFDPFVETALRREGLDPTIYEVTRTGDVPASRLLRSQRLALVKLHGGSYSLRAGFDCDEPLTSGELAEYREYLSPTIHSGPPLVLVLGYSGSDRRVMQILGTHLEGISPNERHEHPRIIWVSRDGSYQGRLKEMVRPFRHQSNPPVRLCAYRDVARFLQELHQTVSGEHAVGHTYYKALTPVMRIPPPNVVKDCFKEATWGNALEEQTAWESRLKATSTVAKGPSGQQPLDLTWAEGFRASMETQPGIMFTSQSEGAGTSSYLAKACQAMERTHMTIWIDAGEFNSRATLFAAIEDAFHRFDRNISMISHPLMFRDADYIVRKKEGCMVAEGNAIRADDACLRWAEGWEEDVAIRWLRNSLRRGRYVLAIDSLGEFALGHPATILEPDRARQQVERAFSFLRRLLSDTNPDLGDISLGESKVFLAVTNNVRSTSEDEKGFLDSLSSAGIVRHSLNQKVTTADGLKTSGRMLSPALREFSDMLKTDANAASRAKALVLTVASFYRRARDHAGLLQVLHQVVTHLSAHPALRTLIAGVQEILPEHKQSDCDSADIGIRIAEALRLAATTAPNELQFLVREEGGFYWMHQTVRDEIFTHMTGICDNGIPRTVIPDSEVPRTLLDAKATAQIFSYCADFYHDGLYERSQDSLAFLEYFFHRCMSVKCDWDSAMAGSKENEQAEMRRLERARYVVSAIELEKERLLTRGRLTAVLNHMAQLLELLSKESERSFSVNYASEFNSLRVRVLQVYGDLFLACGHPHEALQYRLLQAILLTRQIEVSTKDPDENRAAAPEDTFDSFLRNSGESWGVPSINGAWTKIQVVVNHLVEEANILKEKLQNEKPLLAASCGHQVKMLRSAIDLMIDLGVAIGEPVLFENGYEDYFSEGRWKWEGENERKLRMKLPLDLFNHAREFAETLRAYAASSIDVERVSRASIRLAEHRLRQLGAKRFQSIAPQHSSLSLKLSFNESVVVEKCHTICVDVTASLKTLFVGPANSRRRRHKSYLYLAQGRARTLAGEWKLADEMFNSAEAALSRADGTTERAALALVHMFRAEALLLEAEADMAAEASALPKLIPTSSTTASSRAFVMCRDADLIIQQARLLVQEDGRSENRWRIFYDYLKAKMYWLRVSTQQSSETRDDDLFQAMRHVVAAMTNTGMRSDRRTTLRWLWWQIKDAIRRGAPASETQPNNNGAVKLMLGRRRLGLPGRSSRNGDKPYSADLEFYNRFVSIEQRR